MAKDKQVQAVGDVEEVEATDEERCLAVVLCRPHHKAQPNEGKLAIFSALSVRQRNAMLGRLRKLSKAELKAFKDELEGKPPAEAGEPTNAVESGDGRGAGSGEGDGDGGNSAG